MTETRETETREDDILLEPFFAAARARAPEPGAAFLAALVQAADAAHPQAAAPVRTRGGVLRGLVRMLGGWGGVGGLVTAAAAGLWIGFAGSEQVVQLATGSSVTAEAETSLFADSDILVLAAR